MSTIHRGRAACRNGANLRDTQNTRSEHSTPMVHVRLGGLPLFAADAGRLDGITIGRRCPWRVHRIGSSDCLDVNLVSVRLQYVTDTEMIRRRGGFLSEAT